MTKKIRIAAFVSVAIILLVAGTVAAQYTGYSWSTAYQVVNMGNAPADITIDYYDELGDPVTLAQKKYLDVPAGSSRLVVQFTDDPNLPSGRYSAVVSADQPVAAIANQQLVPNGASTYSPEPPFSTYGAESQGSSQVVLPAVMYNWYGYYTDIFIMNVGSGDAVDVDIAYIPGELAGSPTGASGVTDNNNTIPMLASIIESQETLSSLGAPSGPFAGRFLGSAVITSDEPIVAVVNQHNTSAFKLMTYNGFASGSTSVAVPVHMRGYFGYYSTILIANPSSTETAQVEMTYTPTGDYNTVSSGIVEPVTVNHEIPPQIALTRHDGPLASDPQSDLDDDPVYTRFYGSVNVVSTNAVPVVVQVNVEAIASGDDQAGSYNGIPVSVATQDIVVPVILADFYGYYTTLVVQNATGSLGSCTVTYTSDNVYSAVTNHTASYIHELPASGAFTVYEGRKGGREDGDINSDTQWRSGGQEFIGAASIACNVDAVAFVNEEEDIILRDSMYTFNTFNK